MHLLTFCCLCFGRLLLVDPLLLELNLDTNLIGETASLEILDGLKQRKEGESVFRCLVKVGECVKVKVRGVGVVKVRVILYRFNQHRCYT